VRTVHYGYLIDRTFNTIHRALVDRNGHIFYHGCGGWRMPRHGERLVLFPKKVFYDQWSAGWWESNWHQIAWAWLYMFEHGVSGNQPVMPLRYRKVDRRSEQPVRV
jgi:hypothetical protein